MQRIDARFDAVDARFDAVDARFDAMDARFDAMDASFKALKIEIGEKLDQLVPRLVNAMNEQWQRQFGAVDDKYNDLPGRVTRLEQHAGLIPA